MKLESVAPSIDLQAVWNAVPGNHIIILPNAPTFTIIGVTDSLLEITYSTRENLIGRPLFEIFTDDPFNKQATGVSNLKSSLEYVIRHKKVHRIADQRYDVVNPVTGRFERKVWAASNTPVFSADGNIQYILHTTEDITEKVRLKEENIQGEERLKESESRFRNLVRDATAAIVVLTGPEMKVEVVNEAYSRLIERTPEELLGKPLFSIIPHAEAYYLPLLESVRQTEAPVTQYDTPYSVKKDGKTIEGFLHVVYQPYRNLAGKAEGVMAILQDVTEQVKAKKALQESEAKYRSLFEAIDQGFCIVEVLFDDNQRPVDYRFLETNPAFEKQTGLIDPTGKTARVLVPHLEEHWFEIYGKVALTGKPIRFTEGSEAMGRWFEVNAFRVGNEESRKVAILFTDISERKKADRVLQEHRELLQTVFNASPNSLTVYEPILNDNGQVEDFRFVMVNEFTVQTTGRADLAGKCYAEEFPHVKQTGVLEKFKKVATTGQPAEFEQWYDGEGMRNWFRFIVNKVGKLLVVTAEDITKRKVAEETIHENEERLSNIISQVNAGIAQTTTSGQFTNVNERFCQVTGYTPEELLQLTIKDITHPDDWPRNKELVIKALTEGKNFFIEKRYIRKDGSIVWVNNSVSIVTDGKGEKFITAVSVDITEQITSRQKLEESEERFRSMADASPVMIWTLDEGGNSTYYNTKAAEFTGHNEEEIKAGKSWQVAIHPDDIEYAGEVVRNAVTNRTLYQMECRMQRADGEWRWLLNHGTPRFGKAGEYFGFVGSSIDITEQKKAQQELQTALEQMRLSKEAAELGTFDMDLEKGTMHWDDRCRMLFGIRHHNTVTYENDFIPGLHPDDRDRITKIIGQLLDRSTSNGDYDVEYRTVGVEDGVLRWVRAKGKVYFNEQDKPVRFIGSVLDITEKVLAIQRIEVLVEERTKELAHANEALQNINKELQRSNQSLEEFAHAASHDLKEPIRKIQFFTTHLKSQLGERFDESALRSFGRIENATQRMGLLIEDLLLYSHVSHQPHQTESIDLNVKLKNVMEDLELDIEKKEAIIQVGQLPVIAGYRRQLQQLFQNLISNALKYSKADVPPIIKIEAQVVQKAGKNYHLISVKDNGIGFAQEYANKIFQMFTRLHGKAEYSGTGVGLAIVKKVVENHNGYIEVESVVNEGTVFKIYLPV